jgi:hypothetical protein
MSAPSDPRHVTYGYADGTAAGPLKFGFGYELTSPPTTCFIVIYSGTWRGGNQMRLAGYSLFIAEGQRGGGWGSSGARTHGSLDMQTLSLGFRV